MIEIHTRAAAARLFNFSTMYLIGLLFATLTGCGITADKGAAKAPSSMPSSTSRPVTQSSPAPEFRRGATPEDEIEPNRPGPDSRRPPETTCVLEAAQIDSRLERADAALKAFSPYLENAHLESVRTRVAPSADETGSIQGSPELCDVIVEVWGREVWLSHLWDQVVPREGGHLVAHIAVSVDDSLTWIEKSQAGVVEVPIAVAESQWNQKEQAIEQIRALPEVKERCRSKAGTCDFTIGGFFEPGCVPNAPTECAWAVDLSFVHSRVQREATFYVRVDRKIFVSDAFGVPPGPWSLSVWRCLRKHKFSVDACAGAEEELVR